MDIHGVIHKLELNELVINERILAKHILLKSGQSHLLYNRVKKLNI